MSIAKVLTRALLYVGLALAGFVVIALVVWFFIVAGIDFDAWFLPLGATAVLCFITLKTFREDWRLPIFWVVLFGITAAHIVAVVLVFNQLPKFGLGVWFLEVCVEGPVWAVLIEATLLFKHGYRKKRRHRTRPEPAE